MRKLLLALSMLAISTTSLAQETTNPGSWGETWEDTQEFSATLRDDLLHGAEHIIEIDKAIANTILNAPPVQKGANALDSLAQSELIKGTAANDLSRKSFLEAKVLFLQSYQFLVNRLLDVENYMSEGEKRRLVKNLVETYITLNTIAMGTYAGVLATCDTLLPHTFLANDLKRLKQIATGEYINAEVDASKYTVEGPTSKPDEDGNTTRNSVIDEKRKASLTRSAAIRSWMKTTLAAVYQSVFPNSKTANVALGGTLHVSPREHMSFLSKANPFESNNIKFVTGSPAPKAGVLGYGASVVGAIGITYLAAQGTRLTLAESDYLEALSKNIGSEIQKTKGELK